MAYPQYISCLNEDIPEDDIDRLFHQLQTIEPPAALVSRILYQLPARSCFNSFLSQPIVLYQLDRWVEQNERRKQC